MAEDRTAGLATVQQYRAALESVEVWLARDPAAAWQGLLRRAGYREFRSSQVPPAGRIL